MVDDAFEIQITNGNLGYISQRSKLGLAPFAA